MRIHLFHTICGAHIEDFKAGKYSACCYCVPLPECNFKEEEKMDLKEKKLAEEREIIKHMKAPEEVIDLTEHKQEMKGG